MNITFIGVGYVGLVSGTMLAWLGAKVTCRDMNDEKIYYLQQGKLPLYEPKLDKYITSVIQSGHLRFALLYADRCQGSYAASLTKKIAVEAHPTHVENAESSLP